MGGPRVFGTAEVDAKQFKRLMVELEGITDEKRQRSVLSNAGKASMMVLRDETIRGYQKAGSKLRAGGGSFLSGVTAKGSYSLGKTQRRRGGGGFDFLSWINFKRPGNRLVHLFDLGFTPGGGGLKRGGGRRRRRRPIPGWNVRRRAMAVKSAEIERVFFNAARVLIDLGKKQKPSVSKLRSMGGGG